MNTKNILLKISSVNVTFTREILNRKLHFCAVFFTVKMQSIKLAVVTKNIFP